MNQRIAKIGSLVVAVTVIIFAVCMLIPFNFGSYFICMILLVYFAQTTVVQQGNLNEQAMEILDFQRGGLIFNYDLLGYGIMALSTFFTGTTIVEKKKKRQSPEVADDYSWHLFYRMFHPAYDGSILKYVRQWVWYRWSHCT